MADVDANDRTLIERRDPLVGTVLDHHFRIDFQIAAGGFGAIYRATDLRTDLEVALKVLHPRFTRDPAVVERFRREGKTLAELRDPHTISAYELGEADDGTLYIVMELLHGESLYERFRAGGALPWRRVVHIARGVCSSLAEAHAYGVVHRDLKPANIHLETHGEDRDFVKVLDFGIAKIVQGGSSEHNELTQAGQMIGTIDYMSPEQMVGGEMTPGSDIYTLGVVMYEMISGRTPFADAQTATAILASVLTQAPPPLSRHADVPAALDAVVARCLEREPQARFTDIAELAEALAHVAEGPTLVDAERDPDDVVTGDQTRIDVRTDGSSQPVLDARGPRDRRDALLPRTPAGGVQATGNTLTGHAPARRARGSHPAIDPSGWQPVPDRRSGPLIAPAKAPAALPRARGSTRDPARHAAQLPAVSPPLGAIPPILQLPTTPHPAPSHGAARRILTPPQGGVYVAPTYDMAAATARDAIVRRVIWCVVLAVLIAAAIALI